jgi:hypothetical protein
VVQNLFERDREHKHEHEELSGRGNASLARRSFTEGGNPSTVAKAIRAHSCEFVVRKNPKKSIDILLRVQLKSAPSPAAVGSAAGDQLRVKIKNPENRKKC